MASSFARWIDADGTETVAPCQHALDARGAIGGNSSDPKKHWTDLAGGCSSAGALSEQTVHLVHSRWSAIDGRSCIGRLEKGEPFQLLLNIKGRKK